MTPPIVAATLTPAMAAEVHWHAIVVGSGPAGAAVALRLASLGSRTLLVDRQALPRGKICGCCLSVTALREISLLGFDAFAHGAVPLAHVRLQTVRRSAAVRPDARPTGHHGGGVRLPMPGGAVLSRESFDALLLERAIQAGAHWLPGLRVTDIVETDRPDEPVSIAWRLASGAMSPVGPLRADRVVLATGLADHVRVTGRASDRPIATEGPGRVPPTAARFVAAGSRIGLGAVLPPEASAIPRGELVMAVGRDGYCGIVRLEDGRIDLAAAVDRRALAGEGAAFDLVSRLAGRFVSSAALADSALRATRPLTHRSPLVAGDSGRVLRIGDAAGYVEPFTGEGMGWALLSARLAADALAGGRPPVAPAKSDGPAARYAERYARIFRPLHARCGRVAAAVRSQALVAVATALARSLPRLAGRILPMLIGAMLIGAGPPKRPRVRT